MQPRVLRLHTLIHSILHWVHSPNHPPTRLPRNDSLVFEVDGIRGVRLLLLLLLLRMTFWPQSCMTLWNRSEEDKGLVERTIS